MQVFLWGVCAGFIMLILTGFLFAGIYLLNFLAKRNIFFTIVQEGRAKAILKFGKFHKIVMAYKGYGLDEDWNVRQITGQNNQGNFVSAGSEGVIVLRPLPHRLPGGLFWIGVPFVYLVYQYEFRWTSYEEMTSEKGMISKPIYHSEKIDYILVQDEVYYTFLDKTETSEFVPLDIALLLTVRIVNPYKALFRIQRWLEALLNMTKPAFRKFVYKRTYAELQKKTESTEKTSDEFLLESNVDDFLEKEYGIGLRKVGMATVEPAGERGKEYQAAATKKYEAEREMERIETTAEAEVRRMDRVYGKITSYGEDGLAIKMMETIAKAGEQPSKWIIPWGPVRDLIRGMIGPKEKEGDKK